MSIGIERLRALQRQSGTAPAVQKLPRQGEGIASNECVMPAVCVQDADASTSTRAVSLHPHDGAALRVTHGGLHAPCAVTSIDTLRRLLNIRGRPGAPIRTHAPLRRTLPGVELEPGLRLIETHQTFDCPAQPLPLAFAKRDNHVDARNLMFFDTETTGLSGGTGTRAFMVGAADWHVHPVHGDGLRVRQLLITTLAAEPAMLRTFATWLKPTTVLSSYNGRCYDAPLLRTRYRLARMPDALGTLDHVDLLFPTRRRYRGTWENCRLATIERELLKIVREDDLPGAQAPAAWLTYLRGGESTLLNRVCAHNHQDVVTLARLLLRLVDD